MIIMHSCGINNNWLMFHVEQINKSRKMFYVEQSRGEQKKGLAAISACRKTQGLIRGRSPLWLYSDLATQGELPRRGKRRPPGGSASNPQKALAQQGFPCIRCWPRHRRKHRMKKLKKVAFSHFFDTLGTAVWPSFLYAVIYSSLSSISSLGFNVMTAESIWWDSILSMWTVSLSSPMVMFWGPSTGIMPSLSNTSPVRVS